MDGLICYSNGTTSLLLIATSQIFNVFKSDLRLELPHILFQIKSVLLGIALELSVLMDCLSPWPKSLSFCSGCKNSGSLLP